MGAGRTQKVIEVAIGARYRDRKGGIEELTKAAAEGYRLGGCVRPIDRGTSGAMYHPQDGSYVRRCIFWLDPAERPSLFRSWQIFAGKSAVAKKQDEGEFFARLVEHENRQGFVLRQAVPCDGFVKDPDKGDAGTALLYLLFERAGDASGPVVLDASTMKEERVESDREIACPVSGCDTMVARMTKADGLDTAADHAKHRCQRHGVVISPSTYEYEDPEMSLLWRGPEDMAAVDAIRGSGGKSGKRTWARMGRERDEDSLTWNVFRYLERSKLLLPFLKAVFPADGPTVRSLWDPTELLYWTVDPATGTTRPEIEAARKMVGESEATGTEPDLVVVTKSRILLIEAKFCSPPVTTAKDAKSMGKYADYVKTSAPDLFRQEVKAVAETIGYQMMRLFAVGHAMARTMGMPVSRQPRALTCVLLTRADEEDLSEKVRGTVHLGQPVDFLQTSWEEIRKLLDASPLYLPEDPDQKILRRYLDNKTAGYEGGKLQRLLRPKEGAGGAPGAG